LNKANVPSKGLSAQRSKEEKEKIAARRKQRTKNMRSKSSEERSSNSIVGGEYSGPGLRKEEKKRITGAPWRRKENIVFDPRLEKQDTRREKNSEEAVYNRQGQKRATRTKVWNGKNPDHNAIAQNTVGTALP